MIGLADEATQTGPSRARDFRCMDRLRTLQWNADLRHADQSGPRTMAPHLHVYAAGCVHLGCAHADDPGDGAAPLAFAFAMAGGARLAVRRRHRVCACPLYAVR